MTTSLCDVTHLTNTQTPNRTQDDRQRTMNMGHYSIPTLAGPCHGRRRLCLKTMMAIERLVDTM